MFEKIYNPKILTSNEPVYVLGLNKSVQADYVWNLFRVSKKNILIITNTIYEGNALYKALLVYNEESVLFYPCDDFLVSEALAVSPDLLSKRIETINEIVFNLQKHIVITNLNGYLRFLPTKKLWKEAVIKIKKGYKISRDEFINKLNILGYEKNSLVTKTGEYANRGYILDIFPFGLEKPIRIEFFDDEIEQIRYFDPETQLSISDNISNLEILPFTEFINEKKIRDIPKRQSLLPRVVNNVSKLSDFLEDNISVFIDLNEINISYEKLLYQIAEFKQTDKFEIQKYNHDLNEVIPYKYINISSVDNYAVKKNTEVYISSKIDNLNENFTLINGYLKKMLESGKRVVVFLPTPEMINDFTNKIKLKSIITNEKNIKKDLVNIIKQTIPNGFIINDYVILSTNEIYSKRKPINYKTKFRYGTKIKDIGKLEIGDYVVHSSFGIGRYLGIVTLSLKGLKKDYLHISYKDGDKLYVPVEKIEYINKYSSKEGAIPKLSKLGGTDWIKQKAKVRGKVKDIAKDLLEISAKRKLLQGFSFLPDDEDQYRFESSFEYEETKDQIKSIKEIKQDMELPYPMDRLLCGDVGYGKTEVAFRAIYKAIKSGKQVAFLCPTTILSKQHFENAKLRFKDFGVNIEVLNRFISQKKKTEIKDNLKTGKIDLIIGTHSLLSKDIEYKDLGLLVIDEEQRFGVVHKEKIKNIQKNVDILTLSATPIPRTLQMSLSGVRGLSLIETPPAYRYPVQTYVLRENDQIIKEAIYKELSREGQVFILYNNVLKIQDMVSKIKKLVPDASVTFIHGQMNKNEIEDAMEDFILGKYNVLVCTTIIETGIDIQNANTLIVIDSDHFGLSQLYQIRGRIGRGKQIAYAYLMYNKNKELNEVAKKRLDAIKEFTELGSGYALAVRDLSIRGAGDILGSEQSGFIDTIGYDMYLKILNEEVEKLKGNKNKDEDLVDKKPFIDVSTHVSDMYADSEDLKIEIHKKINMIKSYEQFNNIKQELEDRFGKLDENITIYMLEELFEALATEKSVIKVDQLKDKIIIYFSKERSEKIDGTNLLVNIFKINSNFSVQYNNKILKVILDLKNLKKHFLYYLVKMLEVIE